MPPAQRFRSPFAGSAVEPHSVALDGEHERLPRLSARLYRSECRSLSTDYEDGYSWQTARLRHVRYFSRVNQLLPALPEQLQDGNIRLSLGMIKSGFVDYIWDVRIRPVCQQEFDCG